MNLLEVVFLISCVIFSGVILNFLISIISFIKDKEENFDKYIETLDDFIYDDNYDDILEDVYYKVI